jgi:hypothetical protein
MDSSDNLEGKIRSYRTGVPLLKITALWRCPRAQRFEKRINEI